MGLFVKKLLKSAKGSCISYYIQSYINEKMYYHKALFTAIEAGTVNNPELSKHILDKTTEQIEIARCILPLIDDHCDECYKCKKEVIDGEIKCAILDSILEEVG